MIDERIAELAASALDRIAKGRWPHAETEIQDGGTFLLIRVEKHLPAELFDETLRRRVAMELNGIVPSFKDQLYSWIVVFKNPNSEVYESLLPSGL